MPENFEEAGYEVPKTRKTDGADQKIVADGGMPWCIGLGSGGATGWPATDWVEDIMLRTQPPETYDKWTKNEIPFNDPAVVDAIEISARSPTTTRWSTAAPQAVAATDFRDSPKGLFAVPPKCYLHHQASFIPSFFPEGTKLGEDADFFYLPPMLPSRNSAIRFSAPARSSMITKDSKAARAFIEFLKTPLAHEVWMAQSRLPHTAQDRQHGRLRQRRAEEAGRDPGQRHDLPLRRFRPDARQDRRGRFWTGMIDLVGGKPAADVAADIQKSWDAIK